ncbi:MAG: hypothetical protein JNL54_03515 [Kineosporiaceae bacterium]|nr:hypothetical protein [Kineosporiaceae bacterium]
MRTRRSKGGLTVQAVAGTHTVLLGMTLTDPTGCLGFAIRRTDHTEGETFWLRGMKTFAEVVGDPPPGSEHSTREHPIQAFQWGDYSAKPDHDYTYEISALGGAPGALVPLATVAVSVSTESEDDGLHGVWFNRGVAGSQAFVRRFPDFVPGSDLPEDHPVMVWLSRGLGEAFVAFCEQALGPGWGLRGAFYEFTWRAGLSALAAARERGADVQLVVHGRDRDTPAEEGEDRTAEQSRAAAAEHGLDADGVIHWRTALNKSALHHHKFLVLTRDGEPVAVWTGSTNLTRGGVYGHSNVGHLIRDRSVARQYAEEWQRLAEGVPTTGLRVVHEGEPPLQAVPAAAGITAVFSPRATTSTLLDWYANLFDGGAASAHITGAFGLHQVFRDRLGVVRPVVRTVLLEKVPARGSAIPRIDPNVRISTGSHLAGAALDQWAGEHLTGFNTHVKYIHTKIIMVDPLSADPTLITGSANYSTASTTTNEENTLVIRPGRTRASSRRAVQRLADIYLTEYQRLFMHFAFRAMVQGVELNRGARQPMGHLDPTDAWAERYYEPGSWRERQRKLFSGS